MTNLHLCVNDIYCYRRILNEISYLLKKYKTVSRNKLWIMRKIQDDLIQTQHNRENICRDFCCCFFFFFSSAQCVVDGSHHCRDPGFVSHWDVPKVPYDTSRHREKAKQKHCTFVFFFFFFWSCTSMAVMIFKYQPHWTIHYEKLPE